MVSLTKLNETFLKSHLGGNKKTEHPSRLLLGMLCFLFYCVYQLDAFSLIYSL